MNNTTTHPGMLITKDTAVQKPTQTPIFVDSVWINLDPLETDPPARNLYDPGISNDGMPRCTIARHGGKAAGNAPSNVSPGQRLPGTIDMGFVDGHTEQVKLDTLWNYYWHLDWNPPVTRPP
jgi:hypothetical protein